MVKNTLFFFLSASKWLCEQDLRRKRTRETSIERRERTSLFPASTTRRVCDTFVIHDQNLGKEWFRILPLILSPTAVHALTHSLTFLTPWWENQSCPTTIQNSLFAGTMNVAPARLLCSAICREVPVTSTHHHHPFSLLASRTDSIHHQWLTSSSRVGAEDFFTPFAVSSPSGSPSQGSICIFS